MNLRRTLGIGLGALNRLPIGQRSVRIGSDRLFAASLDRYVAALAWKFGWLQRDERELIRHEVRPGMVTVDVGANVGFHTLALARQVGDSGRVYAIEPDPGNFRLLSAAVRRSKLRQVRLCAAAAADRAGSLRLFLSPTNCGDHRVVPSEERRAT